MTDKSSLRQRLLEARQMIAPAERARAEAQIGSFLKHWLTEREQPFRCIGAYWPIRGEVNLRPLLHTLATLTAVALPVSAGRAPLRFLRWQPNEPMQRDAFGIPIPQGNDAQHPDCLLLPCVGFDAQGYRLGYGAGCYDRTLDQLDTKPVLIGVSFACGKIAEPFHHDHDVPLDWLVTEQEMIAARK